MNPLKRYQPIQKSIFEMEDLYPQGDDPIEEWGPVYRDAKSRDCIIEFDLTVMLVSSPTHKRQKTFPNTPEGIKKATAFLSRYTKKH